MNVFTRFFRSVRSNVGSDHNFENYYGQLVRKQGDSAPSATEARRDYMAVRASVDRISLY
jgi:hypothetical protein